jgi:thioredoxin-like negative regulator of GroEL
VQELLTQYPDFEFVYIDINQNPLFKGQYMVFTVPTIILFNQGRELQRFSRHISLQELEAYLERTVVK